MITTLTFFIYMLLVAYISWWAYRRTSESEDYFLGGRNLSPATAALSAGASDMSGWLMLGLPGYAFASGLESLWLSSGLFLGHAICWLTVARRLRVFTEYLGALTIPTYFQRRFNDESAILRMVTAFFILFFFLFYVSSGFVAGAKLFAIVFGVDYVWGVVLTFLCVATYTFFGGFLAVSWTDVLQGLLMLLALLLVPVMIIVSEGGVVATIEQIEAINHHLLNPFTTAEGDALSWLTIIGLVGWGFGYFGQPHILARFKAVRSETDIPLASTIAIGWSLLVNLFALCAGLFAVAVFSDGPVLEDNEQVFMLLANTLFHPVIAGVMMAAILAAIMSTADSQLLVCSSAFAEDMMRKWNRGRLAKNPLLLGRLGVFVVGTLAVVLALNPDSKVLEVVGYAWAGLGAAFGPVVLIGLYSKSMSKHSALAGIVVGGLTVLVWKYVSGGIFELYELVPGFILSTLTILLVNKIAPNTDKKVEEQFDTFSNLLNRHKV